MTTAVEDLREQQGRDRPATAPRPPLGRPVVARSPIKSWVRSQALNVTRHAAALRPFRQDEFGRGAAAPSPGHIDAVNRLLRALRRSLAAETRRVVDAARQATADPRPEHLRTLVTRGETAHRAVRATEQVWDWYFEFFGQRQSRFADWLLSCDRIALDVYQDVYMGLGRPKSIPAPPPMSYMRTGFSPATFRRNLRLRRLGLQPNPFPIVQLPYHRLVNPWTLGAILHEVSHNLQNELGLARVVPRAIGRRLIDAGLPPAVARIWVRTNREVFADLLGLLLGGPAVVASLIDILARAPASVTTFNPQAVHPLPLLRTQLSTELLRRMGFAEEAAQYRRLWERIYGGLPAAAPVELLRTARDAIPLVVETICFNRYDTLGDRSLAQVCMYQPKHHAMVVEAGQRLARGIDPGIVPERFLIGAARHALDNRLAKPAAITANFYRDLARR